MSLKKQGSRWVGLCPFHQEKTPSFGVNDEGLWYCFGCGTGGDIFKFVMEHEGLGFTEAVRGVAERAGIPVPEPSGRGRPSDSTGDREVRRDRIVAALQAAQEFFVGNLQGEAGKKAREYLRDRGLKGETVERFGLGYALSSWDALQRHLTGEGFEVEELVAAGLLRRRGDGTGVYDLLRNRVIFPIRDLRGRPLAFGGRVLGDDDPKYLNTPETRVFVKSRTLYGLREAREALRNSGYGLLVEGNLDLLACSQHGFANVVAPLGTALTAQHARVLGHHVDKVVVAFDGDDAGQAAAERTVGTFLAAGFQASVLRLPSGEDPDSFLQREGAEGFSRALKQARPALTFLLERVSERSDVRTPQGKAQALESLLDFVLDIDDRVERSEWIGRISGALKIREDLVERTFAELRQRPRRGAGPDRGQQETAPDGERFDIVALAERDLLKAVLHTPDWLPELREIYGDDAITDARVDGLLEGIADLLEEGGGGEPVDSMQLLDRCDVPGADRLLSRLALEAGEEPSLDYAKSCALGIRRDALRRELRRVQQQIEDSRGTDEDVERLQQRQIELTQERRRLQRAQEKGGSRG